MIDVIVYKPSPYGLVFLHDNPSGYASGLSYITSNMSGFMCLIKPLKPRWHHSTLVSGTLTT